MRPDDTGKKCIGNVGVLDLRTTSAEVIEQIAEIGNVGVLFYTPETAVLLPRLKIRNLGVSIEVPADARFINGEMSLYADAFAEGMAPLSLVVNGQLFVGPDVSSEMLNNYLTRITVNGQLICPRHVLGVLESKLDHQNGQLYTYEKDVQLVRGKLELTAAYLEGLNDAAQLMILGNLTIPEVLPNDVLKPKIGRTPGTGRHQLS